MDELKLKCLKRKKRNHVCSQRKKRICTPHYQIYLFLKSPIYPLNANLKPLEGDVKVKKKSTDLANILLALTKTT